MPNPILPLWEHIPDGEPRVFGNRVYLYGSHDRPMAGDFCDIRLKVWSAPIDDLDHWTCHGDVFHAQADEDHPADVTWTDMMPADKHMMYAPDVVEKDGKYYLFTYIFFDKGCVSVSDKPEGPFKVISTYKYAPADAGDDGVYNDPGVLVDDDGRVFVYYGFEHSHMNELDPRDMCTVLPGSLKHQVIDDSPEVPEERRFFEASSPRKVGDTYYLIYSPRKGSRLAYATADKPTGPFTYRGYIIDNGVDYPGGNDHGSIMKVGDQWYIFYHRMTNGTLFSRQACVERIEILPDGTIPPVEMTSLGFSKALNPYEATPAHRACVLRNGGMIKYLNEFHTVVDELRSGTVVGYKYFDFGEDYTATHIDLLLELRGLGETGRVTVHLDDAESAPIGEGVFTGDDQLLKIKLPSITGRHAVYFTFHDDRPQISWGGMHDRRLTRLERFVFKK